MTTDTETILILSRMVTDAEHAYDEAERELTAAIADLTAAHRREADLAAELIQAREVIDEQQQLIAAHQHTAVLAYAAYQVMVAENERLRGVLLGSVVVWTPSAGLREARN